MLYRTADLTSKKTYLLGSLFLLLGLAAIIALNLPLYHAAEMSSAAPPVETSYSQLRGFLSTAQIKELTLFDRGNSLAVTKDGVVHRVAVPPQVSGKLAEDAADSGALVMFATESLLTNDGSLTGETTLAIGGSVAVTTILGFAFWFFVVKGGSLGRGNKAQLTNPNEALVRFSDVAGCDAEKQELVEVVEFLKNPRRFSKVGARVPAGVLMSGPPGTGKTLLARAVAGEAGVPFFSISGSDFVEMFVGVGAGRVRKMFAEAKKKAPCILFIDEIDAVGRQRSGANARTAHEEREQTLNQLLVEMDGFKPNSGVVVIAATNRPDILDEALLRPGRFSRHIVLQTPDLAGRTKILAVHAAKVTLAKEINLTVVARGTPGFSGAQLMHLVNEAAILTARSNRDCVTMPDFEGARDRILMGTERPNLMAEEDRRLTAYHEAGHAVVTLYSPASDPIHKATIVPRGQAMGMVMRLPEKDSPALRRSKLKADLTVAMGGRVAEEIIFGADEISTGASGDIQMASRIARKMVTEWGMSDALGPLAFSEGHADNTNREIDAEIRTLVGEARKRAMDILKTHASALEAVAQALLERESLSGEEIAEIAGVKGL